MSAIIRVIISGSVKTEYQAMSEQAKTPEQLKPLKDPKNGQIIKGVAQDTNKNGTAGRPTEYYPELCQEMIAFFDVEPYEKIIIEEQIRENTEKGTRSETKKYKLVASKLPTFIAFARSKDIHYATLNRWTKERVSDEVDAPLKYPEFYEAYNTCKEMQKDFLIQNGLQGTSPSSAFIFVAKNLTDMVDRQLVEHDVPDLKEKRDALDNFIDTLRDNVQPAREDVS